MYLATLNYEPTIYNEHYHLEIFKLSLFFIALASIMMCAVKRGVVIGNGMGWGKAFLPRG